MDSNSSQSYDDSRVAINITGGPLSYRYRFEEMHIHYGLHDQYGSEHSVQGYTFPAEVSIRIRHSTDSFQLPGEIILTELDIAGFNINKL